MKRIRSIGGEARIEFPEGGSFNVGADWKEIPAALEAKVLRAAATSYLLDVEDEPEPIREPAMKTVTPTPEEK